MSPWVIAVAVLLAIGVWGYVARGNPFAMVNEVTGGGKLSTAQIASYAAGAGFSGDLLVTMTAIALGESSGNPQAVGKLGEIGLWQIYPAMHPEFDANQLTRPDYNAMAAFQVYQQQGLTAWGAYTNGSYAKYLPDAQVAIGA